MKNTKSPKKQIYDFFITSLENFTLKPGDRVKEEDIAVKTGFSRTPVREVLALLANEGLIESSVDGLRISILDENSITQLYEMREILEGTAAAFAAIHANDIEIAALEEIVLREKELTISSQIIQNNRLFHSMLFRCAHNKFLVKTINELTNTLLLLGKSTLSDEKRKKEAYEEHIKIVEALKNHDSSAAKKYAKEHIKNAYKARIKIFLQDGKIL
ncbi:GntR family transcriptional regulator [Campylobacter hyointestinalis]|uniref:GntR family transcriptional regulator n=1 Tax=Campylobacter hyointestinalis TaxID=198 RepID=A0A562X710_CAMHY|nr:GntR family transcriptional regulator [Campylobacter hyointestinalis]TWO17952.1 GntR family transcriptional regulator [Campylobacter hyointestinalis]